MLLWIECLLFGPCWTYSAVFWGISETNGGHRVGIAVGEPASGRRAWNDARVGSALMTRMRRRWRGASDGAQLGLIGRYRLADRVDRVFSSCRTGLLASNFGKISAFWATAFLVPFFALLGWRTSSSSSMSPCSSIYTSSSYSVSWQGIRLKGQLAGTQSSIPVFCCQGRYWQAGWAQRGRHAVDQTAPAGQHREHKVYVVIFFIFLVANVGGALNLIRLFSNEGVSFFWPI